MNKNIGLDIIGLITIISIYCLAFVGFDRQEQKLLNSLSDVGHTADSLNIEIRTCLADAKLIKAQVDSYKQTLPYELDVVKKQKIKDQVHNDIETITKRWNVIEIKIAHHDDQVAEINKELSEIKLFRSLTKLSILFVGLLCIWVYHQLRKLDN